MSTADELRESAEQADDRIHTEDDGTIVVDLLHELAPYAGKGQDMAAGITSIRIRQPRAGDFLAIEEGPMMGQVMQLAAALSSVPKSVLSRLHWEDYAPVHGVCEALLGNFVRASAAAWRHLPGN